MKCVVTAGPTYEELDEVRRLTNFSTGRLGCELANFLVDRGHEVHLLLGHYATWRGEQKSQRLEHFSTTADLSRRLQEQAGFGPEAVFHAAAVSDFTFGTVWTRQPGGELQPLRSAKIPTRGETVLAELAPTPKIISQLRAWFPKACLVGWKYELEGDRADVIAKALAQISVNRTNACVANGRAYGEGFGLVTEPDRRIHLANLSSLFHELEQLPSRLHS